MTGYIVEAKSRKELRAIAKVIRKRFQLENCLFFPVVELLDVLYTVFDGFTYEVVPVEYMPIWKHAETDIINGAIQIKETVYNRACEGEGRDRMTIAHEIAHYISLTVLGFKLASTTKQPPAYCDPEWQAKCLAAELMIDIDLVKGMSVNDICIKCGVSEDAARYQLETYEKERRRGL